MPSGAEEDMAVKLRPGAASLRLPLPRIAALEPQTSSTLQDVDGILKSATQHHTRRTLAVAEICLMMVGIGISF